MGKGCPVANLYLTELMKVQDTYGTKGLADHRHRIEFRSDAGQLAEQARAFK